MNNWFHILFVLCVFTSSCAQILLKKGANKGYTGIKIYINKEVIIGYTLFLIITFITVSLYRYVKLSTGAMLESLSYIFIPVLSVNIFKEKLNTKKIIGIAFILCGVILYANYGLL